jgi:uncharacterized protein (TIGR00290 family)
MALLKCIGSKEIQVTHLVSTLSRETERVAMHGIREEILDAQASSIGLPLIKMWIDEPSNTSYEKSLFEIFSYLKTLGIGVIVFGDIFLEDLRSYRDGLLTKSNLIGFYPLWENDTSKLLESFRSSGFSAKICCLNSEVLPKEFSGREISQELFKNYPIDPCGENGEYHTVCWSGPIFKTPIPLKAEITIEKIIKVSESKSIKFVYQEFKLTE